MNSYLKFLELKQQIEEEFVLRYGLDARGLSLLAEVGRASFLKQPLTTSDLMKLSKCGSPATIHKCLRMLKEVGLVLDFHQGGNRRTKYLALNQVVENYYSQLNELIFKSQHG